MENDGNELRTDPIPKGSPNGMPVHSGALWETAGTHIRTLFGLFFAFQAANDQFEGEVLILTHSNG